MSQQPFFITGGALPQGAESYVVRKADVDLLQSLQDNDFCYILDTRQSGKSSLKVRTAVSLRGQGVTVIDLDLTRIGQPSSPKQWYYGLMMDMADQVDAASNARQAWQSIGDELSPFQLWFGILESVILAQRQTPIVIFIDEIDVVRSLPFCTDEFFAGIRECYHRRTRTSPFRRLTFCLLGVAAPTDLIADPRTTPFNVGRRIELDDFSSQEAVPLAAGLERAVGRDSAKSILARILHWTCGHPYLTQRLCRAVTERLPARDVPLPHSASSFVDGVCNEVLLSETARETDSNLTFVSNRLLSGAVDTAALLSLYGKVLAGRGVRDDPADSIKTELKLAGIVRSNGGHLSVRNRIYGRQFNRRWVLENMPDAEIRRQRTAYRKGVLRASTVYGIGAVIVCGLALMALMQKRLADKSSFRARQAELSSNAEAAKSRRLLYFANMQLAPREWESSRLGHLKRLLEETRDNENRGFEWDYWNRMTKLEQLALPLRSGAMTSAAMSEDGNLIVAPMSSGVGIINAQTLKPIRIMFQEPGNHTTVCVALSRDGRILAGDSDGVARVWDLRSARVVRALRGQSESVVRAVFSANGKRILTCSRDLISERSTISHMRIWDANTGRPKPDIGISGPNLVSADISPDGMRVVTGGLDGIARIWDTESGALVRKWLANGSEITSAVFSPDGSLIAIAGLDGRMGLWDAKGRRRFRAPNASSSATLSFSDGGKRILVAGDDGTVHVCDTLTGTLSGTLRHPGAVTFAGFFSHDRRILTIDSTDTLRVWDKASTSEFESFRAQRDFVIDLAFSPDGKRIATCGRDTDARVWDVRTHRRLATLGGHKSEIYSLAYSPDGSMIATGGEDGHIRLWDANTSRLLGDLMARGGRVSSIVWVPHTRLIATGHFDGVVRLWDSDKALIIRELRGHKDHVLQLSCSPGGTKIVSVGADSQAKLWETGTGRELTTIKAGNWLWSCAFSPDGRHILIGCQDAAATVCDSASGRALVPLEGHTSNVHAAAYSPDGKRLLTGSHDKTVRLWDAASGRETLLLHCPEPVYCTAMSPDGGLIAAGLKGGEVRLWRSVRR